ncbi:CRISPR-associated endoribonuclease Cas2 [Sporomusa carbonis]
MRLLVFFDLPMVTPKEKKIYQQFRKFLLGDGYDMVQFSVYCRICNGEDAVDKHLRRLNANLPSKGSVRFLQITDRQYANMKFLVGKPTIKEKVVSNDQITLF